MNLGPIQQPRGFTLLELLIVIAIIGVLASIVLVATNVSREQSQHAKVYQQLKEIEKAFILYAADRLTVWPDIFAGPTNSANRVDEFDLDVLVRGTPITWEGPKQFPGFGNYLKSSPPAPYPGGVYGYSNFNISLIPGCSTATAQGVAIRIVGGESSDRDSLFDYLDQQVDSNDGPTCGRVRMVGGEVILYVFANDPGDI